MFRRDKPPDLVAVGSVVFGLPLIGAACLAVAGVVGLALGKLLSGVLLPDAVVAVVVPVALLTAYLLWFAGVRVLVFVLVCRETRQDLEERRRFDSRTALSDDEFGRLFQGAVVSVAAAVRAELGRFIGREEVVSRLSPADPVLDGCVLVGVQRDSLEWAEFVFGLEKRFGARIWRRLPFPGTVADLVGHARGPRQAGPNRTPQM
jgi:hypothetical protein